MRALIASSPPGSRPAWRACETSLPTEIAHSKMRCLFGLDLQAGGEELGKLGIEYLERFLDPSAILIPGSWPGSPRRRYYDVCDRLDRGQRAPREDSLLDERVRPLLELVAAVVDRDRLKQHRAVRFK